MSTYSIMIAVFGVLPPVLLFALARLERKPILPNHFRVVGWLFVFGYSLKSLYLAVAVDNDLPFRTRYFTAEHIHIGQLLVFLAIVSFCVGALVVGKYNLKDIPSIGRAFQQFGAYLFWPVFILSVFGVASVFYLKGLHLQVLSLRFESAKFFVNEDTGQQSSLGFLLLGADFLVVYFLYYLASGRGLLRPNVFLPAILLVTLNYFLSSQRSGILAIVVGSILISRVRFFDFKSKKALRRLVLVFMTLALLSTAGYIRSERREVSISEIDIMQGIESTMTHIFEGAYWMDPSKLTGIVLRTDEFLLGESFMMFIVAPIPRAIWPEKPNVRIGPFVAQEILGYTNRSGAPPSAIGEFYINFGWPGVVLGMFALGALVSLIRNRHLRDVDEDFSRVRYALFMIVLIGFFRGDATFAVLLAIKYTAASWICASYYARRQQRRAAALTSL